MTAEALEQVLADFRMWLAEIPSRAAEFAATNGSPAVEPAAVPIDLSTLLGQFVALRHEVNLQTKAVRSQQEQNTETLGELTSTLEALEKAYEESLEGETKKKDEALRPLLKTLVDVADALSLARREIQRVQQAVQSSLDELIGLPESERVRVSAQKKRRRWWQIWYSPADPNPMPPAGPFDAAEGSARHVRQLLDSVVAGYTMSLQRIDRAMQEHGLEAMNCAGEPYDPERMEVMEAVTTSGRPAGEVLDEIRPGYLWNGRVFRFALVRVATSSD
jgi:molecular chaperone GrpE